MAIIYRVDRNIICHKMIFPKAEKFEYRIAMLNLLYNIVTSR